MKREINLWGIISILVIIILLWYILAFNMFGTTTILKQIVDKVKGLNSQVKIGECPIEIIPEKIFLNEALMHFQSYIDFQGKERLMGYSSIGTWADGQTMDLFGSDFQSVCKQGELEGENINLVYCKNIDYSKTITPLSEEGVIEQIKTISYSVNLVLEKESERVIDSSAFGDYPVTTFKVLSSECLTN